MQFTADIIDTLGNRYREIILPIPKNETLKLELRQKMQDALDIRVKYGSEERVQKRDRLLSEVNDFLTDEGSFHGTATELLTLLSARTEIEIKSANALTRLLNPQKSMLQYEYGILYDFERTGKDRTLHLTRITDDDSDDTLPPRC